MKNKTKYILVGGLVGILYSIFFLSFAFTEITRNIPDWLGIIVTLLFIPALILSLIFCGWETGYGLLPKTICGGGKVILSITFTLFCFILGIIIALIIYKLRKK